MINCNVVTKGNTKNHNAKWPKIPDQPFSSG